MAAKKMDLELKQGEGWEPDEGDVLIGTVVDVSAGTSEYLKDPYPILTIKDEENGELTSVHCFHDILLNRVLALQPVEGERVGIKFHGKKKTKDGKREMSLYTIQVDGRGAREPYAGFKPTTKGDDTPSEVTHS